MTHQTIDDFFTTELTTEAHQHWQATLGSLVIGLPGHGVILDEVRLLIAEILK